VEYRSLGLDISLLKYHLVGERSNRSEGEGVSLSGAFGSENVGTSNRKTREIRVHRKPKVSLAM